MLQGKLPYQKTCDRICHKYREQETYHGRREEALTEQQFEKAVRLMVNGDKAGLREIYENYLGYIYRIVYEILQSKENAEDVTSEFFIRLWNKAEQYRPGNGHKGYLATMARNMSIDFLRRHRKEELTELLQDRGKEEEQGSSELLKKSNVKVEEEVLSNLSVRQAMEQLEWTERQIVSLKVLWEMTFKEIAAVMEMPMGTVTWKYQNAMKKLRRCGYE